MTDPEKTPPTPAAKEVQRVGRYLTLQNILSVVAIVGSIAGFYFKTSYRLEAAEKSQESTNKILQYHAEWLIRLSMKTGEPPPRRDP